jgi:hypothetical protein
VENGTAQVTFTWHTINTNGQDRLALEAYLQDRWVSVLDANEALPLNGSKTVTVALPQNFGTPTYRLTLKTSMNALLGQQFVTIPYAPAEPTAPSIVSFTTQTQSIDTNLLAQSNTRLVVSWDIQDRQPNTLIRFYQVLPDGTTVTAEPPRHSLWLPSEGEGAVMPRPSNSRDDLHFRMSLVNLNDNTVYDEADITIPVTGAVLVAPGGAVAPSGSASASAGGLNQSEADRLALENGGKISTFSAESSAAGDVTITWDAGSAQSVQLVESVNDGGPTTLYIQLPPSGSMSVPVPENSSGVTYTLRAQGAGGEVATGEVNVPGSGG